MRRWRVLVFWFVVAIALWMGSLWWESVSRREAREGNVDTSGEAGTNVGVGEVGLVEGDGEEGDLGERMRAVMLRFRGDGVEWVSSTVVSGRAKVSRVFDPEGKLVYRVVGDEGELVWQVAERDPREVFYDEVAEDGSLRGGVTKLEETDFLLRLPAEVEGAYLEVWEGERLLGRMAFE